MRGFGPIILAGHIDTVSPDLDKYDTDPFDLTIKDGKGYGLGSIDMKSFTAIIFDQIEEIKALKLPIVIALTTDEETNLFCIENVIKELKKREIKPKLTIIGEPTSSQINTSANGCYEFNVEVFGKSCHSSQPQKGVNSICALAKLITYIEKTQSTFSLTSNCGVARGGDVVNRVPALASLKFDIRSSYAEQVKVFISLIQEKISSIEEEYNCNITLKKELEIPPLQDFNNPLIYQFALENNLQINKFDAGCEAGYFQKYSGDAILFGVGDLALAHKPNEYVVLSEYQQYSCLLLKLLRFIQENENDLACKN